MTADTISKYPGSRGSREAGELPRCVNETRGPLSLTDVVTLHSVQCTGTVRAGGATAGKLTFGHRTGTSRRRPRSSISPADRCDRRRKCSPWCSPNTSAAARYPLLRSVAHAALLSAGRLVVAWPPDLFRPVCDLGKQLGLADEGTGRFRTTGLSAVHVRRGPTASARHFVALPRTTAAPTRKRIGSAAVRPVWTYLALKSFMAPDGRPSERDTNLHWSYAVTHTGHCSRCRGAHLIMSSTRRIISAASVADSSTACLTCATPVRESA